MNEGAIRDAITSGNRVDSFATISGLEQTIRWSINDAMKMRAQAISGDGSHETVTKRITEIILRDYPSITIEEFKLMLDAGISGELGKETWVSGASVLQWLRAYMNHPTRLAIIDEQTAETQEKHRKTKAEIDELNRLSFESKVHSAYEYYKEAGDIFDLEDDRAFSLPQWAAIVYKHYREEGKISPANEERLEAAGEYADRKVVEHKTKKEFLPAAWQDWRDSYLLMMYYDDIKNKRI